MRAFAAAHPRVLAPSFEERANEALHLNQQWLVKQGRGACAWLREAAAAAGGGGDEDEGGGDDEPRR